MDEVVHLGMLCSTILCSSEDFKSFNGDYGGEFRALSRFYAA
jgi:hypothetical protein